MSLINAHKSVEITTILKFNLSDGTSFTINSKKDNLNYITSCKVEEKLSFENESSPVGAISSRVLDVEINSLNNALVPENESSVYYGLMDNTAQIEVTIIEDGVEVKFGLHYVDTWESKITNNTPHKVVISATDTLSKVCKLDVPMIDIDNTVDIEPFINELFENLNAETSYNINVSNVQFNAFPKMQYVNCNTQTVGSLLNDIATDTLTNIYLDREGNLRTDFCCDDNENEATWLIDIMTSAQLENDNKNYNGVRVEYNRATGGVIEEVARLKNQELVLGENSLQNIQFEDIYKVNRIEVIPASEFVGIVATITSAKYNKTSMNLTINSGNMTCDVIIYGQKAETVNFVKETGGDNKLQVKNIVIDNQYIDKYLDTLYQYIKAKNKCIQITCYPSVQLKLGDVCFVDLNGSLNTSGYYKVLSIDWDFRAYAKADIRLKKISSYSIDINSVLNQQTRLLEKRLSGEPVDVNQFNNITEQENSYIKSNSEIRPYLEKLNT